MSGIAGIARSNARSEVGRMLDKIAFRGPAGREVIETTGATLGFVYTECQEPFAGSQCNRCTVRAGDSGHFAQVQAMDGTLWLMRDAAGVAPLYYGKTERGELCFASEVKSLSTVTDDVNEFPPGHFFDGVEMSPWSVFQEYPLLTDSPERIVGTLYEKLVAAIGESIGVGVDVAGVLLSGGLDSSAVAALACRFPHMKVTTFTIGLPGAPDFDAAHAVADFIGATHREIIVTRDELIEVMPEVIYHLESFNPLLVRSSILHYLAARKAAEYVPIVLVGEGADELFAGYQTHKEIPLSELPAVLVESVKLMHNRGLQRVDRCGAAHGLISTVPFLDHRLATFSLRIPPELKIRNDIEKWCLREALAGILPERLLHRPKAKFWDSGGVRELLADWAKEHISHQEFTQERILANGWVLNSREELMHYRLFRDHFGNVADNPTWVGRTVGTSTEKSG